MAWKQTGARHHHRKGNSPFKYMLTALKFPSTDATYLKKWLIDRCKGVDVEEGDVTVIYQDKVIKVKTIAEAVWTLYVKYGVK